MNSDELPADVRGVARADLEQAAKLDAGIRAALSKLEQAGELIQGQSGDDTRARPSCSVNIKPDSITFNFDRYSNPKLALEVLREQQEQIERQLTGNLPQTDRVLTTLAKKKSLVQAMISQFSTSGSFPPTFSATPRRDKRIEKKLRRKAIKFDQARK